MDLFSTYLQRIVETASNVFSAYKSGMDHVYIGSYYYQFNRKMPVLTVTSVFYLVFIMAVFVLVCLLPNFLKPYLLTIASTAFLYTYGIKNVIVVTIQAIVSYLLGLVLKKYKKTWLLVVSIVPILAILVFYKYFSVTMPFGLSFYSFKMISYLTDIYKEKTEPETNPFVYLSYILFFPSISAGPIHRFDSFKKEMKKSGIAETGKVLSGANQLLIGLFEKKVMCDYLGEIIGRIDSNLNLTGWNVLTGILLYSLQIYLDFDSYSNIAIGSARFLGMEIGENFHSPYLAVNLKDFWNRWHISLSEWFRDYIYIPLGGNRKGKLRQYLNVFLVFVISGIWHGNTINFLLWGVLHGLGRVLEDWIDSLFQKIQLKKAVSFLWNIARRVFNFLLVSFLWLPFKWESTVQIKDILTRLFAGGVFDITAIGINRNELIWLAAVIGMMILFDLIRYLCDMFNLFSKFYFWPVRMVLYLMMIVLYLVFGVYGGVYDASDFIYTWF